MLKSYVGGYARLAAAWVSVALLLGSSLPVRAGCDSESGQCAAPSVSITAPANGSSITSGTAVVVSVTARNEVIWAAMSKVELYRNNVLVATISGAGPTYTFDQGALAAGSYQFMARAYDRHYTNSPLGSETSPYGESTPITVSVVKPNVPPTALLSAPANGASAKAPYNGTVAVAVTGSASDSDGSIARVEILVDGGIAATIASASVNTSVALAPGARRIRLRAYDNSGAYTDSAEATVNVAAIGPVTGNVEGISNDASGNPQLVGWACDKAAAQSIAVHLYAGGASNAGGTMVTSATANLASEAAVSTACATSGVAHRWTIPLAAYREAHAGKTLYVHGISTIGGSNLALPQSGNYTMPAPPPGPVLGTVEGIVYDAAGHPSLKGWACDKRVNQSITVQLYANGAAGTGTLLTSVTANLTSEAAIATSCVTTGTAHRWSIPLASYRTTYAGKALYVHGVSLSGGSNTQLASSGSFSVPAVDVLIPVSIQPPHLANADAGSLPGELKVAKGTAVYAMPLALPPGTAGMVPELGLSYGSQGNNGPLGLGWELAGLSRVHRCGRTIAQGETMEGVRFNTNDRLCLDGQRLVLQSGSDYWAANAVYRTELDGFSRISRNGTGFKVENRDGRIGYYGDTASSLVEAQGRTDGQVHSWTISRLEDRSGNRIDFEYQEDATTGEHLPLRIRWGGNANGAAHYARVDFAYENRPDADVAFLVGSHIDRRLRLKTISTYTDTAADGTGGAQARSYRLSYQSSPTSGRSMLRSVQACDAAGACLPATTFDWGEPDPAAVRKFNSIGTWQGPSPEKWLQKYMLDAFIMADFNGDGRSDLLERYQLNGVMPKLYLSTGSGFTVSTQFQGESGLFRVAELGDFDGDGQMDVLGADGEDKESGLPDTEKYRNWRLCYSRLREGRNFECQAFVLPSGQPTSLRMMRDFDGDGRTDAYWSGGGVVDSEFYQSGTQRVCLARGIANFSCTDVTGTTKVVPFGNRVPPYDTLQFSAENVDLDADGRSDALLLEQPYVQNVEGMALWGNTQAGVKSRFYPDPTQTTVESGIRTSLQFKYDNDRGWVVTGFSPFDYGSLSGDLNGDGYSDVLVGFGPVGVTGDPAGQGRATARLCYGAAGGCGRRLPVSGYTLAAFTNAYVVGPGNLPNDNPILTVGDFDRDGKPDFFTTLTGQTGLSVADAQRYQLCRLIADGDYSQGQNMRCERWDMPDLPLPKRNYQNTPSNNWPRTFFGDFDGDGNQDIVIYRLNGQWEVFTAQALAKPGQALDKLVRVTDGLGRISEIDYGVGNDPTVYTRVALDRNGTAIAQAYPKQSQSNVGQLVKALRVSNGQGGWLETRYKYTGAATDLQGRGHLGFARIDATDVGSGIVSTTWSSQDWPYIGMTIASRTTAANGVKLNDAVYTLDKQNPATGTVFPFVKQSVVTRLDLSSDPLGTTTTVNAYGDGWGNLTQQDVTVSGGVTGGSKTYTAKTVTSYLNDSATWLIGRPDRVTASKTRDGTTVTRVVDYDYDAQGLLKTETREPTDASLKYKLVTSYDRSGNAFGLVNKKTLAWRDPASNTDKTRVIEDVTYDAKGRFPTTVKNAIGQAETRAYDPKTGVQTSLTGPNGLTTTWTVNGFGRKTKETRADGTETRSYLEQCDAGCPANATHVEITDHFKGSDRIAVPSLVYRDSAGHVLRMQTYGYDGRAIVTDQRYDSDGRLWETDQPRYTADAAILASRQGYDALDRVTSIVTRDEAGTERSTTTQYKGLVTIQTNAKSQAKTDERDALGLLVKSIDAKAGVTLYGRDPWGNLNQTTDPNGNVIKVEYDALGRKTELRDPDLGWIHYDVDPLGQVWQQVSPKQRAAGQSTKFEFDALGRMTARYEPDLESHWVYDHATTPASCASTKSCGQLVESYTGTSVTKDYRKLLVYDSLGRLNTTTIVLDTSYATTQAYDAWGRPSLLAVQRRDGSVKGYSNRYNAMGYLARIERAGLALWQANAQDAANRVLQASLGNGLSTDTVYNPNTGRLTSDTLKTSAGATRLQEGYQYDALGSVTQRSQYWDGSTGFIESFDYDELNRLKQSQVTGKTLQSFTYDAIGNLLSKTGAGTGAHVYPTQGATAVRPHAVQSIPGIGAFTYDDNGNLASGANRTLTWTSFDMPKKIVEGSVSSDFTYGPDHQRTKQLKQDGSTVYYAGGQEVENRAGVLTIKTYWPQGLGVEIDVVNGSTTTTTLNWTHGDRLGSVIGITDQAGALKEKLAYDAWGKRRSLDGASTPDTLDGVVDNKGFTGHEMLDGLDLVHMNGRVYDPLVARFISADPIIQDPEHSQSYNRYTYVWNNPTNLTDPTGFECERGGLTMMGCGDWREAGSSYTKGEQALKQRSGQADGQGPSPQAQMPTSGTKETAGNNPGWQKTSSQTGTQGPVLRGPNGGICDAGCSEEDSYIVGERYAGAMTVPPSGGTGGGMRGGSIGGGSDGGAGFGLGLGALWGWIMNSSANQDAKSVSNPRISEVASLPPEGPEDDEKKGTPRVYRGGASLEARTIDVRIDRATGLVKPGRGVSLSSDPQSLQRFGGAKEVVSIPDELQIVRTSGSHYEIAPRSPMSMERYQQLLNQVKLK